MREIGSDHSVRIEATPDNPITLVNRGDTFYYGQTSQVSSTSNDGSVANGASLNLTIPTWVRSASQSFVDDLPSASVADPRLADPWKDVGYGAPQAAAATTINAAGTYPGATSSTSALQVLTFDFDPAYWLIAGATGLKLRCIYRVATNAVGPGRDLTLDLRLIDGVAGGSGANTITGLTLVTGTQTTIPSPSANSRGTAVVLPQIDAPAAGLYSICLTVDGAFATNSRIGIFQRVQVKNVFP